MTADEIADSLTDAQIARVAVLLGLGTRQEVEA